MLLTHIILTALLLLSEVECSHAKSISYRNIRQRRNDLNAALRRADDKIETTLFPRDAHPQPTDSITGSVTSSTDNTFNATQPCIDAVGQIGRATNPAGIVTCYDIPFLNTTDGIFTSELRLYQISEPSGAFTDVKVTDVQFTMNYPAGTTFTSMNKVVRRASQNNIIKSMGPMSFYGQIDKSLDLSKLNTTELMSLVIPTIQLEAVAPSTGDPITTNLTTSDIAFFPTGVFAQESKVQTAAADKPALAIEATTKASGFVLPGTKLGIFPTGLIVTGAWTVLFLSAFGMGTVSRWMSRRQFRLAISKPRRRRT